VSGTIRVSWHHRGKTRKVKSIWIYWSRRYWVVVASAGPYTNLHLDPDTQPCQHPTTQFFTCPSCHPTNSIKALTPFYGSLDFVRDNPGEPVPGETFTHSHLSRSWIIPSLLPPSITIHGILPVQFTCLTVFFHSLSPSFLQSISWPGTLNFILYTLLHMIAVFFSKHMCCGISSGILSNLSVSDRLARFDLVV